MNASYRALTCEREARCAWTGRWRKASWTKELRLSPGDEKGTFQAGGPGEQRHFLASVPTEQLCMSRAGEGKWGKCVPKETGSFCPGAGVIRGGE